MKNAEFNDLVDVFRRAKDFRAYTLTCSCGVRKCAVKKGRERTPDPCSRCKQIPIVKWSG